MEKKMMITGEVIKKPEHIELGKYNVTVRTKGGKELIGMTAAFSAFMVDEVILADKVSYSRKG